MSSAVAIEELGPVSSEDVPVWNSSECLLNRVVLAGKRPTEQGKRDQERYAQQPEAASGRGTCDYWRITVGNIHKALSSSGAPDFLPHPSL